MTPKVLCLDLGSHTGYVTNMGTCGTWVLDKPKYILCHEYLLFSRLRTLWNREKFHTIVCEDVYANPKKYKALYVLYGLMGIVRCFSSMYGISLIKVHAIQARKEVFGKPYYKPTDLAHALEGSKFAGIISPIDKHQRDATVLLLWWYKRYESGQ